MSDLRNSIWSTIDAPNSACALHAAQFVAGELRRLEQDLVRDAGLADVVQQPGEAQLLDVFERQSELLADEHRVVHDARRMPARHVLARVERRRERRDGLGVVVADAAEQRSAPEGGAGVGGETVEQRVVLGVVAAAIGARHEQVADLDGAVRELDGERRPVVANRHVGDDGALAGDRVAACRTGLARRRDRRCRRARVDLARRGPRREMTMSAWSRP